MYPSYNSVQVSNSEDPEYTVLPTRVRVRVNGIKGKISSNCVMENYTKKGMTKFIGHSYKNRVNC
jgi:hypothetical protein